MTNAIIVAIDELAERFGVAFDWTAEHVFPYAEDLARRLVRYETVQSAVMIAVSLAIIAIFVTIGIRMRSEANVLKESGRYTDDDSEAYAGMLVLIIIVSIVACIVCYCQALDIISCLIIPEKIIMTYLREYHIFQ